MSDSINFDFEAQGLKQKAFDLISIEEVAELRGVSVRTVRRWEADGKAPPRVKHGRQKMYRKSDLPLWPQAYGRQA